jgi:hypothetical protein
MPSGSTTWLRPVNATALADALPRAPRRSVPVRFAVTV